MTAARLVNRLGTPKSAPSLVDAHPAKLVGEDDGMPYRQLWAVVLGCGEARPLRRMHRGARGQTRSHATGTAASGIGRARVSCSRYLT